MGVRQVGKKEPLELDFTNHDNIFQIISRLNERQLFTEPGQATGFIIGLKLFSEVLLKNRAHPLFATLGPAFGEFMQQLKGGPPAAGPASAPAH